MWRYTMGEERVCEDMHLMLLKTSVEGVKGYSEGETGGRSMTAGE